MPVLDVFGGLIKGFGSQVTANRAEQARQTEAQMGRDQKIFEHLATSDDPEIQSAALNGLSSLATGSYTPKKGLSKFLGGDIQTNPAITRLFDMLRTHAFNPGGGEPSDAGAGDTTPSTAPPAQAPAGSMGMAPSPSAPGGGVKLPQTLSVAQPAPVGGPPSVASMPGVSLGPPPAPGRSAVGAMQSGVGGATFETPSGPPPAPTMNASSAAPMTGGGPPPQPQRVSPRGQVGQAFFTPSERVRQEYIAKAQGDVEGDVAGYVATGMSREDALAQVRAERLRKAAGSGGTQAWAEGEIIQKPDGTWVQTLYRRDDPHQQMEIPATSPALKSVGPPNADAQLAAEMFGKNYPGRAPVEILQALNPAQRATMQTERERRAQAMAYASGSGAGAAAVNTELNKPIGVTAGAAQGIDPTTSLRELRGITPITAEDKDRVQSATNLVTQLAKIRDLVIKVFPPGTGLTGGLTAAAVLAAKHVSRDTDLAALEASIGPLKSQVARVIALEKGNLSQGDVARSEVALPQLEASLLNGDTQESALRRLDELDATAAAVVQAIKTPAAQLAARQGGAAGAPGAPAGAPRVGDHVGTPQPYTGAKVGTKPDGTKVGQMPDGTLVPLTVGPDGKYYF